MDKKGDISSAVVDFAAYATYIIVIVAFFFLFQSKTTTQHEDVIKEVYSGVNGDQFLISYLASSIEVQGSNMTMGEFIVLSYERNSFDDLEKQIDSDFDRFKNSDICVTYLYLQSEGNAISSVNPLDITKPLLGTVTPCKSNPTYLASSHPIFLPTHSNKKICVALATAVSGKGVCGNE